jgi:hypothetical protein
MAVTLPLAPPRLDSAVVVVLVVVLPVELTLEAVVEVVQQAQEPTVVSQAVIPPV